MGSLGGEDRAILSGILFEALANQVLNQLGKDLKDKFNDKFNDKIQNLNGSFPGLALDQIKAALFFQDDLTVGIVSPSINKPFIPGVRNNRIVIFGYRVLAGHSLGNDLIVNQG